MNYSLGKETKLKGKTTIAILFKEGKSIRKGALRLVYHPISGIENHKIGFVVPKRYIKKAVDRNRIKRLIKESYRLQQHNLNCGEAHIHAMFLYQSHHIPTLDTINKWMSSQLKVLSKRLNEQQDL